MYHGKWTRTLCAITTVMMVSAGVPFLASSAPGPEDGIPPVDQFCPDPVPMVVAVPGPGHVLVRWFPTDDDPLPSMADDGELTIFQVSRSDDGGPFVPIAQTSRASSAAAAEGRLSLVEGDEAPRLLTIGQALNESVGKTKENVTLMDTVTLFDDPLYDAMRRLVADGSWRIAYALGLAWLDEGKPEAPLSAGHYYRYRVGILSPEGTVDPVAQSATLAYAGGAEFLAPPSGVEAFAVADSLPDVSDGTGANGDDWARSQRLRWAHHAISLNWDMTDPGPASCFSEPPAQWPAGYDVYRRGNFLGAPKEVTKVNGEVIRPMGPHAIENATRFNDTQVGSNHVDPGALFRDEDRTLKEGREYCYTVHTVDLLGQPGSPSAESCETLVDRLPPGTPLKFKVQRTTSNGIEVSWEAPTTGADHYEVWRTDGFHQDEATEHWHVVETTQGFSYLDPDVAIGEPRWYKARALDAAGNPSAFTRTTAGAPEDVTAPGPCRTEHHGAAGGSVVPIDETGVPHPPRCSIDAEAVPTINLACIKVDWTSSTEPLGGVLWFRGDNDTDANLELIQEFLPSDGDLLCDHQFDLPYPKRLCVKLQGVDLDGNRGELTEDCLYPNYGHLHPLPPPPTPVILSVKTHPSFPMFVEIEWDAPAAPWLYGFAVTRHVNPEKAIKDCKDSQTWVSIYGKGERKATLFYGSTDPGSQAYFTVVAIRDQLVLGTPFEDWAKRCSEPALYQPGMELMQAYHPHTAPNVPGGLFWCIPTPFANLAGEVELMFGGDQDCRTEIAGPFIVYRSLHPAGGFVAITPPIYAGLNEKEYAYIDADAKDARFYYQVAAITKNGEVWTTTPAQQPLGPKPSAWPGVPDSKDCASSGLPSWRTLVVGTGKNQLLVPLCSHQAPQGNGPTYVISGEAELELVVPGVGPRSYAQVFFSNVEVKPFGSAACPNSCALLVAGSIKPALTLSVGATPDAGTLRYRLENFVLDPKGMKADVVVRMPTDLQYREAGKAASDHLVLAGLPITQGLAFETQIKAGAANCAGKPSQWFEMTTLPLRVIPRGTLKVTPTVLELNSICASYDDPFVAPAGQPGRSIPATSWEDADANDAFLRGQWDGKASIDRNGLDAKITTDDPLAWTTAAPYGFFIQAQGGALEITEGEIHEGQLGPATVEMAFRTTTSSCKTEAPNKFSNPSKCLLLYQEHTWSLPAGIKIQERGAMVGEATILGPEKMVSWDWGAYSFDGSGHPWTLIVAETQSRGVIAEGDATDDTAAELLGPESQAALENRLEPGMNYHAAEQKFLWRCVDSSAPTTALPVRLDIYLRQQGVTQNVMVLPEKVNPNEPVAILVRGYPGQLLQFNATFLDTDIVDSDIRIRIPLPSPAGFEVMLLKAQLEAGCVTQADVPKGTEVNAVRWALDLAPQTVEFRETLGEDGPDGGVSHGMPEHSDADYPHQQLWLLGEADLPHLDVADGQEKPKNPGWVPVETAWSPYGQSLDGFPSQPILEFDGYPFLASWMRLSHASEVWIPDSGGFSGPFLIGFVEEPIGAQDGSLRNAPCDPDGECANFLRYEGALTVPYWGQSSNSATLTVFAPGAQRPSGVPIAASDYVGLSEPLQYSRGWTQKSQVPQMQPELFLAQEPVGVGETPSPPVLVGIVNAAPVGTAVVMDVGTIVGLDAAGNPDTDIVTGMAAGTAVLRAAFDELDPAAVPPSSQLQTTANRLGMAKPVQHAALAHELWSEASWSDPRFQDRPYLATKSILDARLSQEDNDLPDEVDDPMTFGGQQTGLLDDWDLSIGEMRSNLVWSIKESTGDYQFERLEVEVRFHETSEDAFLTAKSISFIVDRHGVVLIEGEDIKAKVLLAEGSLDFTIRLAPTRFDGGLSLYGVTFGTVKIQAVHGVFGAGTEGSMDIFYFGISGDGVSKVDGTAIGVSFLFGTIDSTSKPILRKHGFSEVVDYLESGNEAEGQTQELVGMYARGYAVIPIYSVGSCMLSINGGGEFGFWFYRDLSPKGGFLFGSKIRVVATGDAGCIVSVRGDFAFYVQIQIPDEGDNVLSGGGEGWVAGGVGFCDPEDWTSWQARFWDDDFCVMVGAYFSFTFVAGGSDGFSYDVDFEVDAG